MEFVVWLGIGLIFSSALAIHQWRTTPRRVTQGLRELSDAVRTPLTTDAEQWLRPQLVRRDRWIWFGTMLGMASSSVSISILWEPLPQDVRPAATAGLAVAGLVAGAMVGTFAAAYQTFPKLHGALRSARPFPRQVSYFVPAGHLRSARWAAPMPFVTMFIASAIVIQGPHRTLGVMTFAYAVLAAVLMFASFAVQRVLVGRPMVSSSDHDLIWQDALLAATIQPISDYAMLLGWSGGLVGVYATYASREDLPAWLLVLSAVFLVVCMGSIAVHIRADLVGRSTRISHRQQHFAP